LEGLVPDGVIQVMRFTPTVAFCTVWRYSFAQSTAWLVPLGWLAYLLLWAGAMTGIVIWLMRQHDRQDEGRLAAQALPPVQNQDPSLGQPLPDRVLARVPALGNVASAPRSGPRILWAIFAKDMREAISNKLILSLLIGSALVIINGSALPLLLDLQWKPAAVVYDEGRSTLVRGLMAQEDFRIRLAESREEFEDIITTGPGTWLGLILPADFDQQAGNPSGIRLEGFVAHWADEDKIQQATAMFVEQLSLAAWSTVQIELEGHELYPDTDAGGQISLNLMTALIAMTAIGISLVPLLLVEEKESHTLEAILVSPARYSEVLLGKALVGSVYCLLTIAVAVFFNRTYIVHWETVLLAAVVSAAFAVSLGMLVGVLADNPTSVAVWALPILLVVLAPTLAQFFSTPAWPAIVRDLLPWTPGSVMINLFRLSVAGQVPAGLLWANLAALASMAAAVYLLVGWRLRRLYR
jgi:ABC-type multidrug transport system permease subunit